MTCGQCICYVTDEDENGNVTEFHHCTGPEGFCSMLPLFTSRRADDKTCSDFVEISPENTK